MMRMSGSQLHNSTWTTLTNIMLRKRSQPQKITHQAIHWQKRQEQADDSWWDQDRGFLSQGKGLKGSMWGLLGYGKVLFFDLSDGYTCIFTK